MDGVCPRSALRPYFLSAVAGKVPATIKSLSHHRAAVAECREGADQAEAGLVPRV